MRFEDAHMRRKNRAVRGTTFRLVTRQVCVICKDPAAAVSSTETPALFAETLSDLSTRLGAHGKLNLLGELS